MTQWRIRLLAPDADGGRQALCKALAQAPVTGVRLDPPCVQVEEPRDVIIELAEEEALGELLRALHEISPQVFISRVGPPDRATDHPIKVRKLAPTGAVRG